MAEPREASLQVDRERLQKRRRRAGLSLSDLARKAEISPQYMSMIERGRRRSVSAATYNRIIAALEIEDHDELLLVTIQQDAA